MSQIIHPDEGQMIGVGHESPLTTSSAGANFGGGGIAESSRRKVSVRKVRFDIIGGVEFSTGCKAFIVDQHLEVILLTSLLSQSALPLSQVKTQRCKSSWAYGEEAGYAALKVSSYGSRAESSASHESPKTTEKKVMRSFAQGIDLGGEVAESRGRDKNVGPVTKGHIFASIEEPEEIDSGNAHKGEEESQPNFFGKEKSSEQGEVAVVADVIWDLFRSLFKSASKKR